MKISIVVHETTFDLDSKVNFEIEVKLGFAQLINDPVPRILGVLSMLIIRSLHIHGSRLSFQNTFSMPVEAKKI